jgi:hypothetical protein
MKRIQYHRYGRPEEIRLETYELPALRRYVHDRGAVPARHREGFLRRLESIGKEARRRSTK